MSSTFTERIIAPFHRSLSRDLAPPHEVQCPECGEPNRRRLSRDDRRCWNCLANLPLPPAARSA